MKFFLSENKKDLEKTESKDEVHGINYEIEDILLCGSNGKIYALNKNDGARLWVTRFPSGIIGAINSVNSVVSIFVTDNNKVIVGATGRTACLDIMTGAVLWVNSMSGFGIQETSIISTPSRLLQHKIESETDTLPMYNETLDLGKPIVFGCSSGQIMAINPENGREIWRFDCPWGGFNIPVVIVDPRSSRENKYKQNVYIGAGRWVYCLQARTGGIVWSTKVSNFVLGSGYITLAKSWNSRLASEAYSAFSKKHEV